MVVFLVGVEVVGVGETVLADELAKGVILVFGEYVAGLAGGEDGGTEGVLMSLVNMLLIKLKSSLLNVPS